MGLDLAIRRPNAGLAEELSKARVGIDGLGSSNLGSMLREAQQNYKDPVFAQMSKSLSSRYGDICKDLKAII